MSTRHALAWLVPAALIAAASPLGAQTVRSTAAWPDPRTSIVTPAELAFTREVYDTNVSEAVYLMARFNDGWVLMASLFEFRNAFFHKWGVYVVVSNPLGRDWWLKYDMRDKDVATDPTRLYVSDGANTIEEVPGGYHLVLEFPGFACDLRIENILPPWKGGDGVEPISPDGRMFARRIVGVPWGRVRGSMDLGSRAMVVVGQGMLDRTTIVEPLNRLDPLLYASRLFSPPGTPQEETWFVEILDTTTHEAYGSVRRSELMVARGRDWLFVTPRYTLEARDYRRVSGSPYLAPRTLRVQGQSDGYVLDAEYRAETLFSVTDVMEEIPRWIRPIVSALVKRPVYYRFLGVFEGTLTYPDGHVEPFRLEGPYEYVVTR